MLAVLLFTFIRVFPKYVHIMKAYKYDTDGSKAVPPEAVQNNGEEKYHSEIIFFEMWISRH